MIKVGVIGCGAIGSELIKAIKENFNRKLKVIAVCDMDEEKARRAIRSFKDKPEVLSMEALIKKSDLVVEAASSLISAAVAKKALAAGKEVMIMSMGGLVGREDIFRLANKKKRHVYLPSGALCGLDGIKSAGMAGIKKVTLITRKPPKALEGAPYLIKNKIDLKKIKKDKIVFAGNAQQAVEGFPKNINVSAILSLAGIGPKKTEVKIICSPAAKVNSHTVIAEGDFGQLIAQTNNLPSPVNAKTSYLAVLSAQALLKSITEYVKIGN